MLWQILKKAIFYEYEEGQFKNADNLMIPRSVMIATYKYYLIRNEQHECRVILEQESWTGDFIGFCTAPLAVSQAIGTYNKMIACGSNPSSIQALGLAGKLYEKTDAGLEVLENDFGILDIAEGHLPDEEVTSQISTLSGGYKPPVNNTPQVSGFQIPQQPTQNARPVGLPGIPGRIVQEANPQNNIPKPLENTVPLKPSDDEDEEDEDLSSLPSVPYLPQEETSRPSFSSGLIQKRPPSTLRSDSYDEEEEEDFL